MSFLLNQSVITGKSVTVWVNTSLMGPTLTITAGIPVLAVSGGTPAAVSTLGRIKFDNTSEHAIQQASNLGGGVARPPGIRMLRGYLWAWGDTPPVFPNDLFGVQFTLDGVAGHSASNPCLRCTAIEVFSDAYTEEKRNKVFYVCHFMGAGFDFKAFTEVGAAPNIDPLNDNTQPVELPTKGLGLGIGPQGSISGSGTPPTMNWGTGQVLPFVESMHLRVEALADDDWSSSFQGIGYRAAGDIDWHLKLRQRINQWSLPTDTLVGDLDGVSSLLMATRLNTNLSFQTGWALEGADLTSKAGEYNHDTKILTTDYTWEKTILQQSGTTYLGSITNPVGATKFGTVGS